MAIEKCIVCDKCGGIMAAGRTVREAWWDARQAQARRIDGKHYHGHCVPLPTQRTALNEQTVREK